MDKEILAMNAAVDYLDKADERQKERFIFHLTHRYFPEGEFTPKRYHFDLSESILKDNPND
tara:strand:- start:723 stop:905 length:183 start_codon:yes stop_codon:yes gene_type:complete